MLRRCGGDLARTNFSEVSVKCEKKMTGRRKFGRIISQSAGERRFIRPKRYGI